MTFLNEHPLHSEKGQRSKLNNMRIIKATHYSPKILKKIQKKTIQNYRRAETMTTM